MPGFDGGRGVIVKSGSIEAKVMTVDAQSSVGRYDTETMWSQTRRKDQPSPLLVDLSPDSASSSLDPKSRSRSSLVGLWMT